MEYNFVEERENRLLAPYAAFSSNSEGRMHAEPEHDYRGPYQRDRDRILHSSAFRRLSGKTQVFTGEMGDYHRTRLTHTMEVSSIARTIARALGLNEDLVEALALLHDIGHPPFGHAGEDTLDECLRAHGGFSHNQFALTLVCELEQPYAQFPGLNLTHEVLASQRARVNKSPDACPLLEAQVVDIADSITYDAHDVDDAVKLHLLTIEQLLKQPLIQRSFGRVMQANPRLENWATDMTAMESLRRAIVHELIDIQVNDVISAATTIIHRVAPENAAAACRAGLKLSCSSNLSADKHRLEKFLYRHVYRHPRIIESRRDVQHRLHRLFAYLLEHLSEIPARFAARAKTHSPERAVGDYVAGMTDHYCLQQYERLFGKLMVNDPPASASASPPRGNRSNFIGS